METNRTGVRGQRDGTHRPPRWRPCGTARISVMRAGSCSPCPCIPGRGALHCPPLRGTNHLHDTRQPKLHRTRDVRCGSPSPPAHRRRGYPDHLPCPPREASPLGPERDTRRTRATHGSPFLCPFSNRPNVRTEVMITSVQRQIHIDAPPERERPSAVRRNVALGIKRSLLPVIHAA